MWFSASALQGDVAPSGGVAWLIFWSLNKKRPFKFYSRNVMPQRQCIVACRAGNLICYSGQDQGFPGSASIPDSVTSPQLLYQIAGLYTVRGNDDIWSFCQSCNLPLKLPDLVTLNFMLYVDISTKSQWHSLAPQPLPQYKDRIIAWFNQVLGVLSNMYGKSTWGRVSRGEVFRLHVRAECRTMLARASWTFVASQKWGWILHDVFLKFQI